MFACCIFFSGFCFDLVVVLMFVLLFLFLFSKFIRFREGCIAFPCNYKEVFFFLFFKVNFKGMLKNLREFFWSVAIFKYKFDRDVISRNNGKLFSLRLCSFFTLYSNFPKQFPNCDCKGPLLFGLCNYLENVEWFLTILY